MRKQTKLIASNRKRVLVLGASGLLGESVFNAFRTKNFTFGTYFKSKSHSGDNLIQIDLSDSFSIKKLIKDLSPTHIINCFGLTDVELCEKRPEATWKLNTDIPAFISNLAFEKEIRFIHISTDHYFSKENMPRNEKIKMVPVNQYGYSKFNAEKFILQNNPSSLILRTNFFGHSMSSRKSIFDFALSNLQDGKSINGFEDVVFSPVGVEEISKFLTSPVSNEAQGLLNFTGVCVISKFDFLIKIAEIIKAPLDLVKRSSIKDSFLKVKRPNYLALDCTRLMDQLGYQVSSLEEMLRIELKKTT